MEITYDDFIMSKQKKHTHSGFELKPEYFEQAKMNIKMADSAKLQLSLL